MALDEGDHTASHKRPRRDAASLRYNPGCVRQSSANMECTVKWLDPMTFVAATGSNHVVVMDAAPEGGGTNRAPRPMELVLAGTGGCSAYDVVLILKRGRHRISGCEVELKAERAPTDPKVFTRVHMHYRIRGEDLDPAAVERAVTLSLRKYCSATAMLAKTATVTHDWEIVAD